MPEEGYQVVSWTSTKGTISETHFTDKLIRYGNILYQCFPLNHAEEISKRSRDFVYPGLLNRIYEFETSINKRLERLNNILADGLVNNIALERQNDVEPYWKNGFFNGADAALGYAMIADSKPSIVIEVGAGNSTKFFRRAIKDYSLKTKMIAIDPAPRTEIFAVADEVIRRSVFELDIEFFDQLEANDILFWDGSHVVSNGADITRLILEIIPRLRNGVIVHIHDIFIPYEAAPHGVVGSVSFPEQYMVGTFVQYYENLEILLPVHYLQRTGRISQWGGSFWFRIGKSD